MNSIETYNWLKKHKQFIPGKKGSIISIGSWGDPFPESAYLYTLDYIKEMVKFGNPIQISTKYAMSDTLLTELLKIPSQKNQIVLSTSITTFKLWKQIEPCADSPIARLQSLSKLYGSKIRTNLFIKPFIFGITSEEVKEFNLNLRIYNIDTCVVGVFYWNKHIINKMRKIGLIFPEFEDIIKNQSVTNQLVCLPNSSYQTYYGTALKSFVEQIKSAGPKIFKNITCVSSNSLHVKHACRLWEDDPLKLCVKCGNCF
ncbi:MAG: hypothetical protein HQ534_00570 [Armatimonadetes bacterium]|nr:hypothetical protein [Armatimonadota bacterium]